VPQGRFSSGSLIRSRPESADLPKMLHRMRIAERHADSGSRRDRCVTVT